MTQLSLYDRQIVDTGRKKSQVVRLYELLSDGREHSTVEIMERVYGGAHRGLARVGARVWDLKKLGYNIEGRKDRVRPSVYWYQLRGFREDL